GKIEAKSTPEGVSLSVKTDDSNEVFAKMALLVKQSSRGDIPPLRLTATAYGRDPGTAQALWNAVDDWVRRTSDFHSLFELYGHFTEPHPLFDIESFVAVSDHPVALFAAHAADFRNCSRYFPKEHLVALFKNVL